MTTVGRTEGRKDETTEGTSLSDLRAAAAALEGVAVRTPLIEAPELSRRLGVPVWLKCEQWQPIGAFKVRGAWTAITRLPEASRARGVIAHSSGNHGRAVAWVARRLGLRCVIVMNDNAPAVKVDAVRSEGAEVVLVDRYQRVQTAEALAARDDLSMIPPFEHPDVILGQGTCALEIFDQRPELTALLVPVGGGGLLAGSCAAAIALGHEAELIGVEPEGAAKLSAALAAGRPVALERTASIADGLLPLAVGALPWNFIGQRVRHAIRISDDAIAAAVRFLFRHQGLRIEPSGAIAVAALLEEKLEPSGPVAAILSGGNVDPALFERLS
ncbi:MAG TPA: threonine/serine dehydratase [Gemmatimonadales bacterium]|nr:threonine/serine dehydratase [Gemmatimonadales bacterium]